MPDRPPPPHAAAPDRAIELAAIASAAALEGELDRAIGFTAWHGARADEWIGLVTSLDPTTARTGPLSSHAVHLVVVATQPSGDTTAAAHLATIVDKVAAVNRRAGQLAGRSVVALVVT